MAPPSRAATSRVASQRPNPGEFRGKLYIDPARIPADQKYIWVRESCLGQSDGENVSERMMNGWAPVPADRHPETMPPLLEGQDKSPYIRRGGQILMTKPLVEWQAEHDEYQRNNAEITASVDRDRQSRADKNMPATSEISSRVERNGRFED